MLPRNQAACWPADWFYVSSVQYMHEVILARTYQHLHQALSCCKAYQSLWPWQEMSGFHTHLSLLFTHQGVTTLPLPGCLRAVEDLRLP